MQNFDIATGNFGIGSTILIPVERIPQKTAEYIRNQLKGDAKQSLLTMKFNTFTVSRVILALSDRPRPLRRLPAP